MLLALSPVVAVLSVKARTRSILEPRPSVQLEFPCTPININVNIVRMDWTITYYSEAVMSWVNNLPVGVRAHYARITEKMERLGPNLGMPYTRALGGGLFEIRAKGREGSARVFYCTIVRSQIMILHGFIKKTQKTPSKELALARARKKEVSGENA